jgi:Sec-independent protein secretion pathway component TatC
VPLCILYEGSIWSVRFVEKKAKAAPASTGTPSDGANQPAE